MSYQRIRKELTDFATYYLMPLPALLLPWPLAFRWYYYLAGKSWLFEARVKAACINAGKLLQIDDMQQWKRQHRLTLMIDHIDFWISWLQPRRALRLTHTVGTWPEKGPFIVIGTHYGCGFMLLRELHRAGVDPHFIIRKTPSHVFRGRRFLQFYEYIRLRHHIKLFPHRCYHPGTYPRKLLRGIEHRQNILVLIDVPAERGRPRQEIHLFGYRACVDHGIFNLLIRKQLCYVSCQMRLDFNKGQRHLMVATARQTKTASDFWQEMDQFITDSFTHDSSQWHLWQVAQLYFMHNQAVSQPAAADNHTGSSK